MCEYDGATNKYRIVSKLRLPSINYINYVIILFWRIKISCISYSIKFSNNSTKHSNTMKIKFTLAIENVFEVTFMLLCDYIINYYIVNC